MARKRKPIERIPTRSFGPIRLVFFGVASVVALVVTLYSAVLGVVRWVEASATTDPELLEKIVEATAESLGIALFGAIALAVSLWMLIIQLARRAEESDVVLGEDAVWIPADGFKRRGRHLPYGDVREVQTYNYNRGVRVRWDGGRMSFGRDFFIGRMGDFVKEMRRRTGLPDGNEKDRISGRSG